MIIASSQLVANPLVSVVIATYNQVKYIEQTVMSALTQQCPFPFEVVVGDDGSNDGERELLKKLQEKYPENLKLIFNDKNMMVTRNYVNAIHEARGKYIATLDGDDYYLAKDALVKLVDFLEKNEDVSLVHGGYQAFNDKTGSIIRTFTKWDSPMAHTHGKDSVYALLCEDYSYYPLGSSSCFRREVYLEGCKKYEDLITVKDTSGEGTILNVTMGMAGKMAFIPNLITAYRILDSSLCHFETPQEEILFDFKYLRLRLVAANLVHLSTEQIIEMTRLAIKLKRKNAMRNAQTLFFTKQLPSIKGFCEDKKYQEMIASYEGVVMPYVYEVYGSVYHFLRIIKRSLFK
ncbi:glycosyltransferase family 2 protein [Segatella copri]|uniref:glycosyltransferase family 2 protein n=1 Tax=Segatella copri TaxID=165179 RepID=UPI002FF38B83